jgi:F-type H+-transporting ATPase subunit epsilon
MAEFTLTILTPNKTYFKDKVDAVVFRAMEGDMAVLADHIPMITGIKIGILKIRQKEKVIKIALGGGYADIGEEETTIIANSAESPEEIDVGRAKAAKEKAERRLRAAREEVEIIRAKSSLKRALTRLELAKEMNKRR